MRRLGPNADGEQLEPGQRQHGRGRLDSRALVPHLHHDTPAIQLASMPGEEVSSPGPPPRRVAAAAGLT